MLVLTDSCIRQWVVGSSRTKQLSQIFQCQFSSADPSCSEIIWFSCTGIQASDIPRLWDIRDMQALNPWLEVMLSYTEKRFPLRRASQKDVNAKHNQAWDLELSCSLFQETSKLLSFTCLLSFWLLNSQLDFSSDSITEMKSLPSIFPACIKALY